MFARALLGALCVCAAAAHPVSAVRPQLGPKRSLEFGSFNDHVSGCGDRFELFQLYTSTGVANGVVECEENTLYVDGEPMPSVQLASGRVAFHRETFGEDVVLFDLPHNHDGRHLTAGTYSATTRGGNSETRLGVSTLPDLTYDIYEDTPESKYWYSFKVGTRLTALGAAQSFTLLEDDPSAGSHLFFSLENATEIFSSASLDSNPYMYNVTFNPEWPASGNGEYIYAEFKRFSDPNSRETLANISGRAYT